MSDLDDASIRPEQLRDCVRRGLDAQASYEALRDRGPLPGQSYGDFLHAMNAAQPPWGESRQYPLIVPTAEVMRDNLILGERGATPLQANLVDLCERFAGQPFWRSGPDAPSLFRGVTPERVAAGLGISSDDARLALLVLLSFAKARLSSSLPVIGVTGDGLVNVYRRSDGPRLEL